MVTAIECGNRASDGAMLRGRSRFGRGVVLRGGSFNNNDRNVRAAIRNHNHTDNRNNNVGFRVCASTFSSVGTAGRVLPCPSKRRMAGTFPGRVCGLMSQAGHIAQAPHPGFVPGAGPTKHTARSGG